MLLWGKCRDFGLEERDQRYICPTRGHGAYCFAHYRIYGEKAMIELALALVDSSCEKDVKIPPWEVHELKHRYRRA